VTVGDREVNLGNHYVGVDDPTFLRTTGREDGTVHYEMTTPDRKLAYRYALPSAQL